MGKRYEITGRTATVFTNRAVGEIVELDLDDETETLLRDAGAIRVLPAEQKEPAAERKPAERKPAARKAPR